MAREREAGEWRWARLIVLVVVLLGVAWVPTYLLTQQAPKLSGDQGYDDLVASSRSLAGDARFDGRARAAQSRLTKTVMEDGRVVLGAPAAGGGCWVVVVDGGVPTQPGRGEDSQCVTVSQSGGPSPVPSVSPSPVSSG